MPNVTLVSLSMRSVSTTARPQLRATFPSQATRARNLCVAHAEKAECTTQATEFKPLASIGKWTGAVALAVVLATATPATPPAEAAKSGGRTGGSSFSRARTQQAAPRAQSAAPPVVNNYYSSPSPFGFSPFGFSPFGGFGMGFGPSVVIGAPVGMGLFFNLFLITALLGVVGTVVSSVSNMGKKENDKDTW